MQLNKKDYIQKAHNIVRYPNDLLRNTSLSKETILSISNKQIKILKTISLKLNTILYKEDESLSNSIRSLDNCWRGVIYYANGGRSWDSCKGVNNPYLMGNATIK